jgi:hypothetical protein
LGTAEIASVLGFLSVIAIGCLGGLVHQVHRHPIRQTLHLTSRRLTVDIHTRTASRTIAMSLDQLHKADFSDTHLLLHGERELIQLPLHGRTFTDRSAIAGLLQDALERHQGSCQDIPTSLRNLVAADR